jgi:hypothetical protein
MACTALYVMHPKSPVNISNYYVVVVIFQLFMPTTHNSMCAVRCAENLQPIVPAWAIVLLSPSVNPLV